MLSHVKTERTFRRLDDQRSQDAPQIPMRRPREALFDNPLAFRRRNPSGHRNQECPSIVGLPPEYRTTRLVAHIEVDPDRRSGRTVVHHISRRRIRVTEATLGDVVPGRFRQTMQFPQRFPRRVNRFPSLQFRRFRRQILVERGAPPAGHRDSRRTDPHLPPGLHPVDSHFPRLPRRPREHARPRSLPSQTEIGQRNQYGRRPPSNFGDRLPARNVRPARTMNVDATKHPSQQVTANQTQRSRFPGSGIGIHFPHRPFRFSGATAGLPSSANHGLRRQHEKHP